MISGLEPCGTRSSKRLARPALSRPAEKEDHQCQPSSTARSKSRVWSNVSPLREILQRHVALGRMWRGGGDYGTIRRRQKHSAALSRRTGRIRSRHDRYRRHSPGSSSIRSLERSRSKWRSQRAHRSRSPAARRHDAAPRAGWLRFPAVPSVSAPLGAGKRDRRPAHRARSAARRSDSTGQEPCLPVSDSSASAIICPINSRVANSNAWPSPARWRCSRRFCCSTNRPAPWIRGRPATSRRSWPIWRGRARRWSS